MGRACTAVFILVFLFVPSGDSGDSGFEGLLPSRDQLVAGVLLPTVDEGLAPSRAWMMKAETGTELDRDLVPQPAIAVVARRLGTGPARPPMLVTVERSRTPEPPNGVATSPRAPPLLG